LKSSENECVKLGRLQGGTVVGGREMEFGLGYQQGCTGTARIQNSFFNDHKKNRGWILRSETRAVIRRGSQCVFSEGSDILLFEVEKLHKVFNP
jgi:hypothetical protein